MVDGTRNRFGALEIADGAVWLGTPHVAGNDWGLRLAPDVLTHWGLRYRRDVPWSEITRITVELVEPEQRGRVSKTLRGAGLAVDFALSMASGGPPASSTGGISGSFVRVRCSLANPADQFQAEGAANWSPALTPTERRAAEQLPRAMLRSERFRGVVGDPAALSAMFDDLRAADQIAAVDEALRRAAGVSI